MKVTFWSSACAEGCTTYEQLIAKECRENGSCSTTLNIKDKDEINNILEVAVRESYLDFYHYIHPEEQILALSKTDT